MEESDSRRRKQHKKRNTLASRSEESVQMAAFTVDGKQMPYFVHRTCIKIDLNMRVCI